VVLLGIDKQGQWHVNDASQYLLNAHDPAHIALNPSEISVATVPGVVKGQLIDAGNAQALAQIDVVFLSFTARWGRWFPAGMLRMANLPFVGSDVLGSAACMDKDVTKRLLRDAGLNIAPFVTLTRANRDKHSFAQISGELGLPLFVKPANQGSSVGVSKVTSEAEFTQAVRLAFEFDHKVVVEQGIKGREIECAVLGNDFPQASTCGEVVLNSDFYSYDTKYIDDKGAQVVVPADIDPAINDKIRAIAIRAYQTRLLRHGARGCVPDAGKRGGDQ
jgi:D-alanine-D-alanine ligase